MTDRWAEVDGYIAGHLLGEDPALDATLTANAAAGLPPIDVSALQGKMLQLFAHMVGPRHILEVGTLGGYSTTLLARALPADGKLVTLEIDPHHAKVAQANLARAGVADRCEIRVGPAIDSLNAMIAAREGPFDFVFIDADKQSNSAYLDAAIALSRPGTAIVVDNVIREGEILDPDSRDPRVVGTRALFEAMAADPRISTTAIQTVGTKKWDGFALALVIA